MKNFLLGLLVILNIYAVAAASFDSNCESSDSEPARRDILTVLFDEAVLTTMPTDFLIRLSDAEMKGITVLPERKEDIKRALRTQIQRKTMEEVVSALVYAFEEKYTLAFEFILSLFQCFDRLIQVSRLLGVSDEFIEELELQKTIKADYIKVTNDEFDVDPSEFEHLAPEERLAAAIKKLVGASAEDSSIDSNFLKDYFIGKYDLKTTLTIYEIEMMDNLHLHDAKGVIERYLKFHIFLKSNDLMAQLALEIYSKGCFSSLKFIIDHKFSYASPLSNPLWFQDLSFLFKYAHTKNASGDFYAKVIELASPAAIRKYMEKSGFDQICPKELESEENLEVVML